MPRISVVIITKDRPGALAKCLDSVANQTFTDHETLVVYSASDTGTREAIEETAKKHGARSIRDRGRGRAAARNTGVRESSGDIIVFFDDDIVADEKCLEELAKMYGKDVAAVGGSEEKTVTKGGNWLEHLALSALNPLLRKRSIEIRPSGRVTGYFKDDSRVQMAEHLKGFNMSIRHEALEEIKGWDEWYTKTAHREETDVFARLRDKGHKFIFNPGARAKHEPEKSGREDKFNFFYSSLKQHQYFVFKNRLLKKRGLLEYGISEFFEHVAIVLLAIRYRDDRFFRLPAAKIRGIREGIRARWIKGSIGDM